MLARRLSKWVVLAAAGLVLSACVSTEHPGSPGTTPEQDAGEEAGGAGPTEAGPPYHHFPDAGPPETDADAPLDRVDLGILALPLSTSAASSISPASAIEAHLAVSSAGGRAFSLGARWDELMDDDGMLVPDAWDALDQALAIYDPDDTTLLFSFNVVDGEASSRPSGLEGGWDDAEIQAAATCVIDELFARFPERIRYLEIGHGVDRFLRRANQAERSRFLVFTLSLFEYARQHQKRPSGLGLGAGAGFDELTRGDLPELMALVASSDVVMSEYVPLDAKHQARDVEETGADLDALIKVTEDGPSSIVLTELGYPSAEAAGSSLEQQRRFFDEFFEALESRRSAFPFVDVLLWNDPSPSYCSSAAAAVGAPNSPTLLEAYCSLGLRETDKNAQSQAFDKPALTSVLDALASFHTP